jgi:hypothetical protein
VVNSRERSKRSEVAFVLNATHQVVEGFGGALIPTGKAGVLNNARSVGRVTWTLASPDLIPRPYVTEREECGWQSREQV